MVKFKLVKEKTMKKSEFEKRHGKVNPKHFANWNNTIAKKYGLVTFGKDDDDQPAHIWHILQNLNGAIDLETVQNVFKYLSGESRKEVRDQYLRSLDYVYFADFWGRFSRMDAKDLSKERKTEIVKIIKTIKRGFQKYKFKPSSDMNYWIIKFGGHITQKHDFEEGTKKLQNAEKLPRKLKKQVKKGFFEQLFGRGSK